MTTSVSNYYGDTRTADYIMESMTERAFITCTLLVDLVSADRYDFTTDNFADCLLNKSNVLSNGDYIAVSCFFDHKVLSIAFDPVLGNARYNIDYMGSGTDDFNPEVPSFYTKDYDGADTPISS